MRTNAGFLVEALDHPDFVAGNVDTGFIAREGEALMPPVPPSDEALADAAAALAGGGRLPPQRRPPAQGRFLLDGEPVEIDFAEGGAESVETIAC